MTREAVEFLMTNDPLIVDLSEAIDALDVLDHTLDNLDQNTDQLEMLSRCLRNGIYIEMGEMLHNLLNEEDEDEDSGDQAKDGGI